LVFPDSHRGRRTVTIVGGSFDDEFRRGLVFFASVLLAPFILAAQEPDPAQQPQTETHEAPAPVPTGPPVTVRGMVSNAASGDPLPRVLVRIEGDADAGVLTNGEGRFEIPSVPVGPQTFRLLKPGFHDRPYATEDVDYQADGPAHSVLVAARMPDLNYSLVPNGAIHGYVELSTGDPAQNIPVVLVKQVIRNGRAVWAQDANARTNGDGAYRFAGLPEGVYAVYTQPALESEPAITVVAPESAGKVTRSGYPGVFYPNSREFSSAMLIRLSIGEQAQADLGLTLEPFQTVTATAFFPDGRQFAPKQGSESGSDTAFASAAVLDAAGRRLPYIGQFDEATHTIQADLPDGIYTLQVNVTANDQNIAGAGAAETKASRRQVPFTGFAEFSIEGHAVTNLRIPLSAVPSWPVHLKTAQSAMRPPQSTMMSGQGLQNMVTISTADAAGTPGSGGSDSATAVESGPNQLDLNGAGFGPLWIDAQVNDRSLCVGSFTAGGINLAREPVNLNPSATPLPMELTLRSDCATLTLELPPALSAFLPGEEPFYTVYVVPDFDTTANTPPMNIHPSSGGYLNLDGLTPGNYHVYVFDSPVRLEYRNPAVLAALSNRGQWVTLSPGMTASLVLEAPGR
jgi:Carboxypeptidase regulatory-like domain